MINFFWNVATFKTERMGVGKQTSSQIHQFADSSDKNVFFILPLSFNTTRIINSVSGGDMRSCPSALVLSVSATSTPDVGMLHLCASAGVHSLVCVYSRQLMSSGRWGDLGRTSRSPLSSVARRCDLVNTDSTGILKCCTAPKGQIPGIVLHSLSIWGTFSQRMICS